MKRFLAVLASAALWSCQSSDPGAVLAPEAQGGIALRPQADSPLRRTDSVKVVLSYKQNLATVTVGDSVPWSRSGVKLTGLPLDIAIRVRMEAWDTTRGRRLVYWTAETTTTLSKSSPAWDFTSGSQLVPIEVKLADATRYVGPVASVVAQPSRGAIDGGVLKLVAAPGVTDSVLFDPVRVDSVYVDGVPLALEAGMYRIRVSTPDTLSVLLVGRNGLTSPLSIEVAEPPPVVHVLGLGAHWESPTPPAGAWVGAFVPLAIKVDSGNVDRVVVRFGVGDSLVFAPGSGSIWTAQWEPAAGSVDAELKAYAVGGGQELPLPSLNLNVDLVKPRIEPLTFKLDAPFRVGKSGSLLEFKVLDTNQTGLTVWANTVGQADSLVPTLTDTGYQLHVLSSVELHARDRLGNQFDLSVPVVLDAVGPVLSKLQGPNAIVLQPGSGAVETSTGEVSLSVAEVSDPAGVNEVWAMNGSARPSWDRQTKVLVLPNVGTWTIYTNDFLGNESVWGTVVVRYPAPAKPEAPTVTPASGVYGGDSLKWGARADTLVPVARCTEGRPQVQVDGKVWRDFEAGKEFWAMAGGEAKASYRCRTDLDSSDPVARTWVMLHEPFLTYGGVFYDSIKVRVARDGILPNGPMSTNPLAATLELCGGDSASCAGPSAIWTQVSEMDTILWKSQNLSARLMMLDNQTGRKVYSRALSRFYQRLLSDRVDWSPAFTRNADAAWLKSQFGVVDSGTVGSSRTLRMDDSVLELRTTWAATSGTPFAWIEIPFETDGHPWSLIDLASFDVLFSDSGAVSRIDLALVSDAYDPSDANNGYMFQNWLSTSQNLAPVSVSLLPVEFELPSWGQPLVPVTFGVVQKRARALRFVVRGLLGGGGSVTFRIHKIVLKGTMTRLAK